MIWASIGIAMLYSAGGGSFEPWAIRQVYHMAIGFLVMLLFALSNPSFWLKIAWPFYGFTLFLLILVEIMGDIGMGAQRWLDLGILSLQPSEMMKVGLILVLARYFHDCSIDETRQIKPLFVPFMLILMPSILVIRQPDLGTAILLAFTGFMVLFLAGVRIWKFVLAGSCAILAVPIAWNYLLLEYQKKRVMTFLNPELDPLGSGYNILQSKIALGSGGFSGRGFLGGTQSQHNFLPEKQTDFIFTMLGEAFGLLGTYGLLLLFIILVGLGSYIAFQAKNHFSRLLAFGLINNFALYVFINIAMVTGLLPVVGVPLPLISYGGTVVVSVLGGFGLILMVGVNRNHKIDQN